jgi:hypothetical protein
MRMRRSSAPLLGLLVAAISLAPAAAPATAATKRSKAAKPKITRVTPMRVTVGDTLTIRGQRFKAKPRANTVVFQGAGGRTAFVKPRAASKRKLVVKIPASVSRLLVVRSSRQTPTRIKLRVLAGQFSAFTPRRLSPVVTSLSDAPGGAAKVCKSDSDHDNDLLSNADELEYKTDPCLADTDGDGLSDGWEYYSAKDLNLKAVPYPGKRPYPNPLDPSDLGTDFDGDSLSALVEYKLWRFTGSSFDPGRAGNHTAGSPLGYSDGTQASRPEATPGVPSFRTASYGYPFSPPAYPARYVMPHPGAYHAVTWTDDERDGDADGLNNYIETAGPGLFSWWEAYLLKLSLPPWPETYWGVFNERPFSNVDPVDSDVDGDTLLDGEDDQDNDDVLNFDEMYDIDTLYGPDSRRKNAFNPCAPDGESRSCPIYQPF